MRNTTIRPAAVHSPSPPDLGCFVTSPALVSPHLVRLSPPIAGSHVLSCALLCSAVGAPGPLPLWRCFRFETQEGVVVLAITDNPQLVSAPPDPLLALIPSLPAPPGPRGRDPCAWDSAHGVLLVSPGRKQCAEHWVQDEQGEDDGVAPACACSLALARWTLPCDGRGAWTA